MTPELEPPLLTSTPHQREDVSASTDLTCIAPLHAPGLEPYVRRHQPQDSNPMFDDTSHEFATMTSQLNRTLTPISKIEQCCWILFNFF
ncbi:hypothetical protein TNCV_307941 [Trichonephila clavipes]|nr:hypothetical protein TNCV_307941 [Trichonephila clavipes]